MQLLGDPIPANVVGILAHLVIPTGSGGRVFGIPSPETGENLPGEGSEGPHQSAVKEIPGGGMILAQALPAGVVQQTLQDFLQRFGLRRF